MNARCELCGVVAVIEEVGLDERFVDCVCPGCGANHIVENRASRPAVLRGLPRPSRPSPPPLRRYVIGPKHRDPERLADLRALARRCEAAQGAHMEDDCVVLGSSSVLHVHGKARSPSSKPETMAPARRTLALLFGGALVVAGCVGLTAWRFAKTREPAAMSAPAGVAPVTPLTAGREAPIAGVAPVTPLAAGREAPIAGVAPATPLAAGREAPRSPFASLPGAALHTKTPQGIAPLKTFRTAAPPAIPAPAMSAPPDPAPAGNAAPSVTPPPAGNAGPSATPPPVENAGPSATPPPAGHAGPSATPPPAGNAGPSATPPPAQLPPLPALPPAPSPQPAPSAPSR